MLKAKKVISYELVLSEEEYKDVQVVLQEKTNNSTITPTQAQLLQEINSNL